MMKPVVSDALRGALGRRAHPAVQAALWALATAVFYLLAMDARYAMIDEFAAYGTQALVRIVAVAFTAIFALSYAVQLRVGRHLALHVQLLLGLVTGLVLLAKISLLDYVSDDYAIFLSNWIYDYSNMGIKQGLGTFISSDYSPPYLYLMLLVSRVRNYPWQYLVKAISVFFEVLLATGAMKLSALRVKGALAQLLIYHMVSILPTVVFNGAYWGQCDAIYVSLAMMGLYLALTRRPAAGMLLFGVALSFKFQTVFFLPVLLPLWLRRDIGLKHVLLIPAAYMGMMIPALWGGKSLHHVLTVYLQQADAYNIITMNGPNLYQFLPDTISSNALYNMFGAMAMALGVAMMALVCYALCTRRARVTQEATVLACVLMLGGLPFFLPKMHERYTFGADVLSIVPTAYRPRRIAATLCFGFASYAAYTAGLPGDMIMDLKWAALFQLAGIVLTAAELWRVLSEVQEPVIMEVKA